MERILLVEDDCAIIRSLSAFLQTEGFAVTSVTGQADAVARMEADTFDLLLVDLTLTDGNGFGVFAAAKERELPVVFLTASGDEYSVVIGLDMGADDYVSKPFRPRELVSRMRSVLRRRGKNQGSIRIGALQVDVDKGVVLKNGSDIFLSALEYRLLLAFLNCRGQVLTRARLMEEIWDVAGEYVNDNTLTVYIKRLREKIEDDPAEPEIIKTVRGIGYRMEM